MSYEIVILFFFFNLIYLILGESNVGDYYLEIVKGLEYTRWVLLLFDRNNIKNAIYWALWKHYNYENYEYIYEYGYSKIYGLKFIVLF